MEATSLVEEPISAELVLVDPELARRARLALPDPPWLLRVLAEQQPADVAAPPRLRDEGSPRHTPRVATRPRRRSVTRHIAGTLAGGCVLLALTVAVATAADLFRSDELTFSTTPVPHAARPRQNQSVVTHAEPSQNARRSERRTKRRAERSEGRGSVKAKASPKAESPARAPRPAAATPRVLTKKQRVFSWRGRPAALYYQFYFQRGATTIYQVRTAKLSVTLPARLKLRPGTYQVLVRPAIPSDAGVILGTAIVSKTIRV